MSSYNQADLKNINVFIQEIEKAIDQRKLDSISNEWVQKIFALAMQMYVLKLNENPEMLPFVDQDSVSATDAVITISRILKQVDIQVFELAMWQTMGTLK